MASASTISSAGSWARALLAVAGRQLPTTRRYPVSTANILFIMPMSQLVLPAVLLGASFAVGGHSVGLVRETGSGDLVGWLTLGMAIGTFTVAVVWGAAFTIAAEREQGTLEVAWTSAAPREAVLLGMMLAGAVLGLLGACLLVFSGYLVSAHYHLGLLMAVPVLPVLAVGVAGYAYLAAAVTLALRQADSLIDGAAIVVIMLSGAAFPISVLPPGLEQIGYGLPTTWGIDLLRHYAVGSVTLVPPGAEWPMFVSISGAWPLLGRTWCQRVERRLHTDGAAAQH